MSSLFFVVMLTLPLNSKAARENSCLEKSAKKVRKNY